MAILDNVQRKKAEITANGASPAIGLANQKLAIAAIIGGIKSPAWEEYMKQYVDPSTAPPAADNSDLRAKQLARLLGTDDTRDDPDMQERRAYMVANATCAQPTGEGLDNKVGGIDNNLP